LRPQGPEAQTGLGNYFASVGKSAIAILYFQKAADRGYGEAYFYLAEAQRQQGAGAEALANYRRYLGKGGHGENAGIAQRAIRDLAARYDRANEKPESPGDTATPREEQPTPAPPTPREDKPPSPAPEPPRQERPVPPPEPSAPTSPSSSSSPSSSAAQPTAGSQEKKP
jgi:hypothetical protein